MVVLLAAFCEVQIPNLFRHSALASMLIASVALVYIAIVDLWFEANTDRIHRFLEERLIFARPRETRLRSARVSSADIASILPAQFHASMSKLGKVSSELAGRQSPEPSRDS